MATWQFKLVYALYVGLFLTEFCVKLGWIESEWIHTDVLKMILFILAQAYSKWVLYFLEGANKSWLRPAIWGFILWSFIVIFLTRTILFEAPRSLKIGLFGSLFVLDIGIWLLTSWQNRQESEEWES
jgi:hypothetical protein